MDTGRIVNMYIHTFSLQNGCTVIDWAKNKTLKRRNISINSYPQNSYSLVYNLDWEVLHGHKDYIRASSQRLVYRQSGLFYNWISNVFSYQSDKRHWGLLYVVFLFVFVPVPRRQVRFFNLIPKSEFLV